VELIDGRKISTEILKQIELEVANIKKRKPGLALILVGENQASESYIRSKDKTCTAIQIQSTLLRFPTSITEDELLQQIFLLNQDPEIDGILVQLPLPAHINEQRVTRSIDPAKDVDGFHPTNLGKLLQGDDTAIPPCTPEGIKMLLEKSGIPVEGKHVVIVGRSNIVGKPLAALLMQKKPGCNATVTLCHSQTKNLGEITRSADILIAAIGQPLFIKKEMVKPGAVVIDVGINRLDGKIVGDVDFEQVAQIASHITPVPGGVGPMTIAMLMKNTLDCFLNRIDVHSP
jgi:methylenetetrahydrofolate dehydrogenase (NADP+)/methenyltetrahydrofolate cyclohydrolase